MSTSTLNGHAYLNTARGTPMAAWTPYLALFVGDPLAGGIEVSGGSYARRLVTFNAPVSNIMVNGVAVTFPTPTGAWGGGAPLTHAALMDAVSGGSVRETYLLGGTDAERTVGAGSPAPSWDPGSLSYGIPVSA